MKRAVIVLSLLALILTPSSVMAAKGGKKALLAASTFVTVETPVVHVGDALVVSSSADGVVTCYGSLPDTGEIVWAYPFVGSHETYTYSPIGVSERWAETFVPLDGRCVLYQQDPVNGVPVEVASSPFSLLP